MLTYAEAKKIVEAAGMDVEDGLGFTFSCADYPPEIRDMNGWSVEEIAAEITRR